MNAHKTAQKILLMQNHLLKILLHKSSLLLQSTMQVEDNTSNPIEIVPSAENNSLSSDQEKSSKDSSTDDRFPAIKTTNEMDTSPIDLMSFDGPSSLVALGLDRLKWALTERGLKCGGTARGRALRLWGVRGLQPHQYPPNLMAKKKRESQIY